MRPHVRSASINGYVEVARSLGIDPAVLMGHQDLHVTDLATPDKWVPAASVARLLQRSAAESGHEDFAVRLAEHRRLATLGPLSVVLREEPDLRGVISLLIRYEHSYNEAIRLRLEESEEVVSVRVALDLGEPAPVEQVLVLAVAALLGIVRECRGPDWLPVSVCLEQQAPGDLSVYHRVFGHALRFGHDFSGVVLYARDLQAKNALADPLMRPYAQQFLDALVAKQSATTTERVRELAELLLPVGRCSLDRVAASLRVEPRTLQRNLAKEGESFAGVLHATRAQLAERHLASGRYSMTEVSELLGFTSPSAFSRWFTQQFGVSPTAWRAATTTVGVTSE